MPKKLLTIDDELNIETINRPNRLFYGILKIVARTVLKWQYNPTIIWKNNFSKVKGPYILISNHASRADYLFNSAYLKERVNHVLGYNEFFRSHLSGTVRGVSCIPKKNFVGNIMIVACVAGWPCSTKRTPMLIWESSSPMRSC